MKNNTQKQLRNAFELSETYYTLLNLGYFFEVYAKRVNLSRLSTNIQIQTTQGIPYTLNAEVIRASLQNIYERPLDISIISHVIFLNSLRGITMAIATALENAKEKGQSEFKQLYQKDVFLGDADITDSFFGINRFVRNVLSHNIEDGICLQEKDYDEQKKHRNDPKKNPFNSTLRFEYDYANPLSAIHLPGYSPNLKIALDLNSLVPDQSFEKAISAYECLLFAEFCLNSLTFLSKKYLEETSNLVSS